MPTYKAPTRDMKFVLHELLEISRFAELDSFKDADPEMVDAIIDEAAKFSEEVLAPLNRVGDEHGCVRNDDGSVTTPPGFEEAYDKMRENGWMGISSDPKYGGQGLPGVLGLACSEMTSSANMAFGMYPGLTGGAAKAISIGGSEKQKNLYLPKMYSGEWTGTMNLTESHCGTDLGLLKTKAIPQPDGTYKITGQKIFISAGEHGMSDNIIHLVLARIEGAPAGVKGISLFIVPKFGVDEDGNVGQRNGVSCGSIEEKMGIHGNSTCVMNFDDAVGELIGEENKGLKVMFVMMNEARIGVGLQGMSQSEVSYQNAAAYANDRLQGRSLTGPKNEDGPADPIIVHPDVRRMLMDARAFNEAARAFLYWLALQEDMERYSPDEKVRERADDYLGLMTPVIKGYLTDVGFANCVNAQQVYGGHGFIEEWGMSQFVRDCRIAMIYEGANGIQALDLVGRKLARNGGRALMGISSEIDAFVDENKNDENLAIFMDGLKSAKDKLQVGTMWLMQNGMSNPDNAGAGSTDYMHMLGIAMHSYMWARMAKVAQAQIDAGNDDPFYADKITTGRYFMARILPQIDAHLAKLQTGAEPVMALAADRF
ncbi:MAG: acyl-CoA dehydrogenase [Acidimicrobiales bacterium]|nr:acyl-CoA dehydrogenase [Hyphomonadaceae bacterium]RZV44319.1 MAG: acyl-CoA dehydrogenase [Acidimicrobiales bacterium]